MSETVRVGLGERSYDVMIGRGLIDAAGAHIAPLLARPVIAVVADQTVFDLHGPRLIGALEVAGVRVHALTIPAGEASKSFAGLADLCDRLLALKLERTDLIIAFGGGVTGDLTGFATAIYKRGAPFVQIPTTLLAQVDSSVGGKTAIDTPRGKNLIGAFHQPRLVLADLAVLDTLPPRQMACGHAEILKCALIGDAVFFAWLEAHGASVLARQGGALAHAVRRAVEIKAALVAADEREGGVRALLNLGHTFGHALEARTGFGADLEHGEAVGLGCALAFRFSATQGLCAGADAERASAAIAAAGLPTRLPEIPGPPPSAGDLLADMTQDKKARGGKLTLILARGIGEAFIARDIDQGAVRDFLIGEGAAR
ncbi:MAG TPA: 3-dehydroquinate synthase [Caulobacteraceae bacterium]|nr:3-dehydroquinate synthase [Caulobacteraceae bacterium]